MRTSPEVSTRAFSLRIVSSTLSLSCTLRLPTTVAQFVATMAALKLPPPAKIDIAVAANRACGDAPERVPQG